MSIQLPSWISSSGKPRKTTVGSAMTRWSAYIDSASGPGWLDRLCFQFSDYLIFGSASRNPEMAGIYGAFIGSLLTLAVCLVLVISDWCRHGGLLWRSSPRRTALPRSSRSTSTIWRRCPRRVRHSGSGGFHRYVWPAALDPADWRGCAGADDIADHHHSSRAAIRAVPPSDPRRRVWVSGRRACRRSFTMSCRWRCPGC